MPSDILVYNTTGLTATITMTALSTATTATNNCRQGNVLDFGATRGDLWLATINAMTGLSLLTRKCNGISSPPKARAMLMQLITWPIADRLAALCPECHAVLHILGRSSSRFLEPFTSSASFKVLCPSLTSAAGESFLPTQSRKCLASATYISFTSKARVSELHLPVPAEYVSMTPVMKSTLKVPFDPATTILCWLALWRKSVCQLT